MREKEEKRRKKRKKMWFKCSWRGKLTQRACNLAAEASTLHVRHDPFLLDTLTPYLHALDLQQVVVLLHAGQQARDRSLGGIFPPASPLGRSSNSVGRVRTYPERGGPIPTASLLSRADPAPLASSASFILSCESASSVLNLANGQTFGRSRASAPSLLSFGLCRADSAQTHPFLHSLLSDLPSFQHSFSTHSPSRPRCVRVSSGPNTPRVPSPSLSLPRPQVRPSAHLALNGRPPFDPARTRISLSSSAPGRNHREGPLSTFNMSAYVWVERQITGSSRADDTDPWDPSLRTRFPRCASHTPSPPTISPTDLDKLASRELASGLVTGQKEAALQEAFHKEEEDDDDDDSSDETASACSATESVLESLFRKGEDGEVGSFWLAN